MKPLTPNMHALLALIVKATKPFTGTMAWEAGLGRSHFYDLRTRGLIEHVEAQGWIATDKGRAVHAEGLQQETLPGVE